MSAKPESIQAPNPNLGFFEPYYHRRLRLPIRFNLDVQTKLAMYHAFDWLGAPRLPRPLEMLRGKGIAVVGALSVLVPPLWSLPRWGVPRDYGLLAQRDSVLREQIP